CGATTTTFTGTMHFTSSDAQAVLPADYTYTGSGTGKDNGVHVFPVTLKTTTSNASVTAAQTPTQSPPVTGTLSAITVNPAAASTLTVSYPTTATAGISQTLTTTAKDAFGNTATGYAGTVHFTSSDAAAALP